MGRLPTTRVSDEGFGRGRRSDVPKQALSLSVSQTCRRVLNPCLPCLTAKDGECPPSLFTVTASAGLQAGEIRPIRAALLPARARPLRNPRGTRLASGWPPANQTGF